MESRTQITERRSTSNNIVAETYKVLPNPVDNYVELQYCKPTDGQQLFILTDVTGRKVLTGDLMGRSATVQFDVNQLQSGVYFYKILDGDITKFSGKLLKK